MSENYKYNRAGFFRLDGSGAKVGEDIFDDKQLADKMAEAEQSQRVYGADSHEFSVLQCELLKKAPENLDVLKWLAEKMVEQKNIPGAEGLITRLLFLDPENAELTR